MSVEILTTAAKLYEKLLSNNLKCHSMSSEVALFDKLYITSY